MWWLHTVEQLVDQYKVILNGFFVKLAKVTLPQLDQSIQKLEYQGGIRVALGDGHQIDILVLDMAEGSASKGQYGRSNLRIGNDLDAKDVGEAGPTVIAKGAEDEVLALLIENEDTGDHAGQSPGGESSGIRLQISRAAVLSSVECRAAQMRWLRSSGKEAAHMEGRYSAAELRGGEGSTVHQVVDDFNRTSSNRPETRQRLAPTRSMTRVPVQAHLDRSCDKKCGFIVQQVISVPSAAIPTTPGFTRHWM